MALDKSTQREKRETLPILSFIRSFRLDVADFKKFLEDKVSHISAEERKYAEEIAQRGEVLLVLLDGLLAVDGVVKGLRRDIVPQGHQAKPSEKWSTETRRVDEYWRSARGLIEEIRWERNRLQKLADR